MTNETVFVILSEALNEMALRPPISRQKSNECLFEMGFFSCVLLVFVDSRKFTPFCRNVCVKYVRIWMLFTKNTHLLPQKNRTVCMCSNVYILCVVFHGKHLFLLLNFLKWTLNSITWNAHAPSAHIYTYRTNLSTVPLCSTRFGCRRARLDVDSTRCTAKTAKCLYKNEMP